MVIPTDAGSPPDGCTRQIVPVACASTCLTHDAVPPDDAGANKRKNGARNPNGGTSVPISLSARVNRDDAHNRATPMIQPTKGMRKLPAEMSRTAAISSPRPQPGGGIGGIAGGAPASC